jgi:hypothetical protein
MHKRIFLGIASLLALALVFVLSVESSRNFVFTFVLESFVFIKSNIFSILAAFFLVKGKFILMVFLKKALLLSATGLGKRFLIEKVITHNLKIHFLDHIANDVKQLLTYIKNNFQNFPLVKQVISGFIFVGSFGFVAKFMGGMLAMKVFIAKVWSFLLVIFLKLGTAVVYFFTDYLWSSWIGPIVEVVIFSWILSWLEKVPYLKKLFDNIANFFAKFMWKMDFFLEKIFHIPAKKFFSYLAKKIKKLIYRFIGYEKTSAWKRLVEVRKLVPSKHKILLEKRKYKVTSRSKILQTRADRKTIKDRGVKRITSLI